MHTGGDDEASLKESHAPDKAGLLAQLGEMTLQRGELEKQLAASMGEVQALTAQLELARQSIRDASRRSQTLNKERDDLAAAQEQYALQIQALEEAVAERDLRNQQLEAHSQSLSEELERSRQVNEQLQAQVGETDVEMERLRAALDEARKNLESSKEGREFILLKDAAAAANGQRDEALQARAEAEQELTSLRTEVVDLKAELQQTSQSLEEMGRKVAKLSDAQLQKDNVVLRSILERQKAELEQRFREVKQFRRANFGVRIAYAIVILAVVVLIGYGLQYLPILLRAG
jgi:kinesin family protein C1